MKFIVSPALFTYPVETSMISTHRTKYFFFTGRETDAGKPRNNNDKIIINNIHSISTSPLVFKAIHTYYCLVMVESEQESSNHYAITAVNLLVYTQNIKTHV